MAMIYALRHNGDLLATGSAKELAERLSVTTEDIRKMASDEWRTKYTKMPYTEFIGVRMEKDKEWRACKENDSFVYRLVRMGMSFNDVSDYIGISEGMAQSAYNRVANGRYGPCEQFK